MQERNKKLTLIGGISLVCFLIDFISKYLVSIKLPLFSTIPIIENVLHITHVRNKGIVFGLFYDQKGIFVLVSILGVIVALSIFHFLYKNLEKLSYTQLIAYSLIFGGALGNSYDRFTLGYVVDFIDFQLFTRGIFNFADAFINLALVLFIFESYFKKGTK